MNAHLTRTNVIVVAVFAVAFATQAMLWLSVDYADKSFWQADALGLLTQKTPDFSDNVLVHPGTAILLPTAALIATGASPKVALNLTIALFVSVCTALICAMCLILRPQSLWWLGAAVLMICNPLYISATVPGAVAGALVTLFVILVFYARNLKMISGKMLGILGICAGVLLATRIDTGLAAGFFSFIYIAYLVRTRVWIFTAVSFLTFLALDPYLWTAPMQHLEGIAELVKSNATVTSSGDLTYTLSAMSLALLALTLALLTLLRKELTSVPADFILYIAAMFIIVCTALSFSAFRPVRYFFPFSNALEVFLPLFVFDLIERSGTAYENPKNSWLKYLFIFFLIVSRALPLLILGA